MLTQDIKAYVLPRGLRLYNLLSKSLRQTRLGKSQFVLKNARKIKSKLISKYVKIEGNKIFLDPLDSLNLSYGKPHEKIVTSIMKKIVKEGDCVIDIGAHIGFYSLFLAKMVGKNGHVYAFEPSSQNFELLKKNIKINGYQNITPVQCGISNKTGTCKLYLAYNSVGHRLYEIGDKSVAYKETVEIQTLSLDDYFKNRESNPVRLIKMDIEGSEGWAFEGMRNILDKNHDVTLITEYGPYTMNESGYDPLEFIKNILKYLPKMYQITENEIKAVDLQQLTTHCNIQTKTSTYLLFCRKLLD